MFDSLFGLLKSKILLAIAYPLLVLMVGYAGYSHFEIRAQKKQILELTEDLARSSVENSFLKAINDSNDARLKILQEQCEGLRNYERNKPQKHQVDDSDINDELFNSLFGVRKPPKKP